MNNEQRSNFFDPIFSVLGVVTSLLATLTPLFSKLYIQDFFISKELASISSIVAFIFSLIFIWIGITSFGQISIFNAIKKILANLSKNILSFLNLVWVFPSLAGFQRVF